MYPHIVLLLNIILGWYLSMVTIDARSLREDNYELERDTGFLRNPERKLVDAHVYGESRDAVDDEMLDEIRNPV